MQETQETQETEVRSLGQEDPLEKEMAAHSSIFSWKSSFGQKSLVGSSPRGRKDSDVAEHSTYTQSRSRP